MDSSNLIGWNICHEKAVKIYESSNRPKTNLQPLRSEVSFKWCYALKGREGLAGILAHLTTKKQVCVKVPQSAPQKTNIPLSVIAAQLMVIDH